MPGPKPASLLDRLMNLRFIDPITGCWLPKISTNRTKYFRITYESEKQLIHRLSARAFLGLDIYSHLQVNHKRECPYKACYNPEHLYIGTAQDNSNDYRALKLYCINNHERAKFGRTTILVNGPRKGQKVIICRECDRVNQAKKRSKKL
jgi:hypothetical protein